MRRGENLLIFIMKAAEARIENELCLGIICGNPVPHEKRRAVYARDIFYREKNAGLCRYIIEKRDERQILSI